MDFLYDHKNGQHARQYFDVTGIEKRHRLLLEELADTLRQVGNIANLHYNEQIIYYNMSMSYSIDARQMALQYHKNGHTLEETSKELKVGISTLTRWKKQLSTTGSLAKAPLERQPRKFVDDELRAYMQENPFATLKQIAEEFGGSITGAFDALRRLNITLKKGLLPTRRGMRKSGRNSANNRFQ